MVTAGFSLQDKLGRVRFFEEIFLLADTSIEVILGMPLLTLSDADIRFAEKELVWRSYTAADALPITQRIELIDRREFATAAFDQIALLNVADAPVVIPTEYSDHISVFSSEFTAKLPNTTRVDAPGFAQIRGSVAFG